jgi:hypothetical protein
MLRWILTRIGQLWKGPQRPEPIPRTCYTCREPIQGAPVMWNGRPHCSYHCIPTVERRAHLDAKSGQLRREADRLDLARKAGL